MQADKPENHQDSSSRNKKLLWLGLLFAFLLHVLLILAVIYLPQLFDRKDKDEEEPIQIMLTSLQTAASPDASDNNDVPEQEMSEASPPPGVDNRPLPTPPTEPNQPAPAKNPAQEPAQPGKADLDSPNPSETPEASPEGAAPESKIALSKKSQKPTDPVAELQEPAARKKKPKLTEDEIRKKYITPSQASKQISQARQQARQKSNKQIRGNTNAKGDYSGYLGRLQKCMGRVVNFSGKNQRVRIEVFLNASHKPVGARVMVPSQDRMYDEDAERALLECKDFGAPPSQLKTSRGVAVWVISGGLR